MSLYSLAGPQTLGNPAILRKFVKELQGLRSVLVTGAAAGTKMNIAAMKPEDTILSAIQFLTAGGAPTNDVANITIQSITASGTITITGDPVANETVTVNGNVYVWKAVPTSKLHVKITAGNNTAMAAALAAAINGYEGRYEARLNGDAFRQKAVTATSALGVVTITAAVEGTSGNAIALSEASTNVAASGANLAGGTATGGIKSTTDLSSSTLLVTWYDKR